MYMPDTLDKLDELVKKCTTYPSFKIAYAILRHLNPDNFRIIDVINILRKEYNTMHGVSVYNLFHRMRQEGLLQCITPDAANRVRRYRLNL